MSLSATVGQGEAAGDGGGAPAVDGVETRTLAMPKSRHSSTRVDRMIGKGSARRAAGSSSASQLGERQPRESLREPRGGLLTGAEAVGWAFTLGDGRGERMTPRPLKRRGRLVCCSGCPKRTPSARW